MTNELHHLAGAYVLNALDADERAAFEAHYPTCDICTADVESFREVGAELAGSIETDPPAHLFESVMDEVRRTPQIPAPATVPQIRSTEPSHATRSGPSRRNILAIAAAVALLFVGGVSLSRLGDEQPVQELVEASDAVSSRLAATVPDQVGEVEVWWSAERDKIAVIGSNLADLDDDQVYALWFLVDDGVAPAALFTPTDGLVEVVLDVDDLTANGWGITVEPAGGSELPTTEVIFAGTI